MLYPQAVHRLSRPRFSRPQLSSVALCGAALFAAAGASAAQGNAWVVDDDGGGGVDFTTLQAAVDAASDHDLILVRAGAYQRLEVVDKALTIVGDEGAVVSGVTTPFGLQESALTVSSLAADKSLVIRNLVFETLQLAANGVDELMEGAVVTGCAGAVLFEECEFLPSSGPGLRALSSSSVTVHRCRLDAGGGFYYSYNNEFWDSAGLVSTNSDVFVFDSTVLGSLGPDAFSQIFTTSPPGRGGRGAQVSGGSVTFQGSSISGGDGGSGVPDSCAAEDGGVGLRHSQGAIIRLLDTSVTGGAGGSSAIGCGEPDGDAGADFDGDPLNVENLDGVARSFDWQSPIEGGTFLPTTFSGEPGDFVFLLATLGIGPGVYLDTLGVSLLLDSSFAVIPLGVFPTAEIVLNFAIPPLAGIQDFGQLAAQAAYFDSEGAAFLSGPSVTSIYNEVLF